MRAAPGATTTSTRAAKAGRGRAAATPEGADAPPGRGVLNRYAAILDIVAASPAGLTFAEIMRLSRLPRGTVHRLLGALLAVGYIEPSNSRKIYVLGRRLVGLLHQGTPREAVTSRARPVLEQLVARFGETAFLAKLEGDQVESIAMVLPGPERHSYVQPGRVMPLHAAASAKAIFAFQPSSLVNAVLGRPRTPFTQRTRTAKRQIASDLERVRQLGYADCIDELDPGVSSYACPVTVQGGVYYSVGIVGLSQKLTRIPVAQIVAALQQAAADLGDRLSSGARR